MSLDQDVPFTIRFPIGVKLVGIITILLLFSLGSITFLVSYMVSGDVRLTAEDNNFNINKRSAAEAEIILNMMRSGSLAVLDTLDSLGGSSGGVAVSRRVVDVFFEHNRDVAFVGVSGVSNVGNVSGSLGSPFSRTLINEDFFRVNEIKSSSAVSFITSREDEVSRCRLGEIVLLNAAPVFGRQILVMLCPWKGEAVAIFFSSESLIETFGAGTNVSFMINDVGDVLVHARAELVSEGANVAGLPFIQDIWQSPEDSRQTDSRQTLYTAADGTQYFGAFQKLSVANAAVITQVEYRVVFEGVAATTRRNILLTGAVLALSILFIWFFSKTLSRPLRLLAAATERIEDGEFEIDLTVKSRDEVGLLTRSFLAMGRGLAERERLKTSFGKFINREIAEQAMRGELTLGGETKKATIFFSDIRDFTNMAEMMNPNEVVRFLNSYMTRMVDCVEKTGGVVDKFIGDALMAVWGAPISSGSPESDALNCVMSALLMRSALIELNTTRGTQKRPIIRIGCGINSGDVLAGQIGSSRRMEYTVVGDAVNLASRTEELTKIMGADILITENTRRLIAGSILTEEMPSVRVKGKENPIRIFAVINLKAPKGEKQPKPSTLSALRRLLDIPAPDLSTVDINAEEQKFKIIK
ncbi:MAG: adenylate/guanylate cyclase domain-containing protein [Spirochaetales bacterium]|jgi:adenylate cyclase|nr:adenylate/guanylate cyclase domain-containing protein [Spirochaetales bacterium]